MGRILVLHAQDGFAELVRRMLSGTHEVQAVNLSALGTRVWPAGGEYDWVLCGVDQPERALEVLQQVCEASPAAHLIPIASNAEHLARFVERWSSDPERVRKCGAMGSTWLPERCTVGQLFALFREPPSRPAATTQHRPEEPPATSELPFTVDRPDIESGTVIDGYRLVCLIGRGGFGASWLAVNEATGKRVALKLIEGDEQFEQELSALRKYIHVAYRNDHLLHLEHVNRDASRLWIVTPLADSITGAYNPDAYKPLSLANRLEASGHLAETDAINITIDLVRALGTLHDGGLLHGDTSPSNILSMHNKWVLADPGLVRFIGQHGICRDRKYYPQAASVRPADDLYAIGVILWDMTSGAWEMVADKDRLKLNAQMLNFLSKRNLPLARIIGRAVAEGPDARYPNAEEMLRDLLAAQTAYGTESGDPQRIYDLLRPIRTGSV